MGKEYEVLQAAQIGNLSKLETLLTQKTSKVFAGLFKGPNINWRDSSGCTALHLAALNGHKEAVIFLLQNDASANSPDNAGSYPLHLAAFNGHYELAKTLITRGPSRATVNEPNMAGDTALHVAAQYGHRYVVQILLECHADVRLRNAKDESALDLAAQYGRLSTVQLFLLFDHSLLTDAIHKHSPLHLAARNGHHKVVQLLLNNGMPVNATCDMGTALHCAALYGKVPVAKLLLEEGIDIDIEDDNQNKVLDLLCKHPSQRSQEITALIYEQMQARTDRSEEQHRSASALYSGQQFELVGFRKKTNTVPRQEKARLANYDLVPPPRPAFGKITDDRPYSLIEALLQHSDQKRISNSMENFDLASITPLNNSGRYKTFFDGDDSAKSKYCLIGDVLVGQKNEESDILSQKAVQEPLKQDSHLYSFPPSDILPANNFNQRPRSEIIVGTECYDNVNLTRVYPGGSANNIYDNVNLSQQESYDNVHINNASVSTNYNNVNITNKLDAEEKPTVDDYYQFPSQLPQTDSGKIPQYTSVKTKSLKQKRTTVKVKKDIPIKSIPEHHAEGKKQELQRNEKEDDTVVVEHLNKSDQQPKKPPRIKQSRTSVRNVSSGYRMSALKNEGTLNETYEWNKIDSFLTDLENFVDANNMVADDASPGGATANLSSWLASLKLAQYEPMFITNGFDDMQFMACLEEQDLVEMGILDSGHRKILASASEPLPKMLEFGANDFPATVGEWLRQLNLPDYENRFIHNGYENMDRVRVIWDIELVTVLDITMLGHRKRIINSLGRRLPPQIKSNVTWAQKFADAEDGLKKSKLPTFDDCNSPARKPSKDNGIDASKPPESPTVKSTRPVSDNVIVTVTKSLQKASDWKHPSELLLTEYVAYLTEYLGSHPVQTVTGVSSTIEACTKMKAISRNVHKMPSITLSISVRGIDYIDSNSKMIISEYQINHISFCAQDPRDLCVFAYITRDQHTKRNYCHVFKAASDELADEIVMTIGQCFELAYQQHVQMNELKRLRNAQRSSSQETFQNERKAGEPPTPPPPYASRLAKK